MFGIWWRIESRQDRKIDELSLHNDKSHREIRRELGETKDELTKQHFLLRDRIEDIWKRLAGKD